MASLLKEGEAVLADRQHAEVADQALVRLHTRNGPYRRHTNGGRSPMRPRLLDQPRDRRDVPADASWTCHW